MFKKPSEVKGLQRLSGADRKKLRRAVHEKFLQASDADIDVILPPKAEVSMAKLANRAHVYTVDGGPPMLFDVDGRGTDIFPTVFALWKVPAMVPAFVLKGAEVSRYVVGGADLMFPGVEIPTEGFPTFNAGEAWCIRVPGNDFPIAVGATVMSSQEAVKAGFRGKALRVLHYYPDSLWESAENKFVPNAGFTREIIMEDPTTVAPAADTQASPAEESHSEEQDLTDAVEAEAEAEAEAEPRGEEVAATTGGTIGSEDVDTLLDRCLLQALHTTVKDKDLPMPSSILWSAHVLPCRPAGTTLDIKKSSHKKLSKWLQSKSSSGLISAKEDKHKKEVILLAVNRGHALYKEFTPERRPAATESPVSAEGETPGSGGGGGLEILELWKSTPHVAPIFKAVAADTSKYYTASEAADVVYSYVEKENLVKPSDKAVIVLDAILCDALVKGAVKKGTSYPTEIHKKDLAGTFRGRMQANHRVTRGNESVVRKGASKCVQIITERRQGNKKVTRVSGLESFLVNADALAAELQKKFACSTSVAELPGKKTESEILVQGGVLEDLGKHLVQQYGIPKRLIEILDKTKK